VDSAAVRAEFDRQMRRDPAPEPGSRIEREERLTRVVDDGDGWNGVLWTDLAGIDADAVIEAQVRRFGPARAWEWKHYSYDQPASLPGRLRVAGFAAGPAETLLVAELADLDLETSPPAGVRLVPVTDAAGAAAVVQVHDEVFGGEHAAIGAAIVAGLGSRPHPVEAVVAVADQTPVSAGRIEFPAGRDFASLWGGGTLSAWRGRGLFRSLVAYRARLARDRGYRYLQVDASDDSRPILERLGFTALARTTPFVRPAGLISERVELQPVPLGLARVLADPRTDAGAWPSWAPGYPLPGTRLAARMLIRGAEASGDATGDRVPAWGMFQVILRDTGEVIGDIGFHGPPDPAGTVEIGYGLAEGHRGRGLAGESAVAICALAWSRPEVSRIIAQTDQSNTPSAGVLLHAGFHDDGAADGMRHFSLPRP
jgi:RimJ/RimL family protein N-acetyltransferase/ribosomal protein S18 acetylase RimI-like enzyme